MRTAVLLILCAASAASGQWLEKTIYLPDSFGVVAYPRYVCFDPQARLAYVSGLTEYVLVFDAGTNEPRARFLVGGAAGPLCTNPTGSKLYVGDRVGNYLLVVDAASGVVTARLPVSGEPNRLFWLGSRGKLYVSTSDAAGVAVVDPVHDSLLAFLPFGRSPGEFCSDSAGEKVYCADPEGSWVAVIDAAADSLLDSVSIRNPYGIRLNPNNRRLYCSSDNRDLFVIDTDADTVVARVRTGRDSRELCCNPVRDKVYCSVDGDEVSVVDCTGDTVLATIRLSSSAAGELLYIESEDKIYCAGRAGTAVIDCSGDSVEAVVPTGAYTRSFALDSDSNTVYCTSQYSQLSVVDAASDSVIARVPTGSQPSAVCYFAPEDKAYAWYRVNDRAQVAVIDGATLAVLRSIDIPNAATGEPLVCENSNQGKVYIAVGGRLYVVDAHLDSLVREIAWLSPEAEGMVCNPVNDHLYLTGESPSAFMVVDCQSDSVLQIRALGQWLSQPGYNPDLDRIYLHEQHFDSGWVDVIDCVNDSIIARTGDITTNAGTMCYNPVNQMLYDADELNPYVALIDCQANQLLGYIRIFPNSSDACCSPRQNRVYISTWLYGIAVVDGWMHCMVDSIQAGFLANDIMYVPGSDRVYCSSLQGVCVVSCASNSVIATIPASAGTRCALSLDSAGGRVYAANEGGSSVLVIGDSVPVSLQQPAGGMPVTQRASATIIRATLHIPLTAPGDTSSALLIDPTGRKVTDLQPGENDIRHLAPGVYFVREEGPRGQGSQDSSVRKVVIQR
jgi:YVTN family beta-propeller protein